MLPERYRTEIRTGRDHDIEEYLAADGVLDRPVLIRQLDPTASPNRRHRFLRSVRQAAAISHTHLIDVYAADQANDIAYAVLEWAGGMTVADRIDAGIAMDRNDFLPNAAGLAEAVDELHQRGYIHGGIDASAIFYTTGHPAKLGAFGRSSDESDAKSDVANLATVLIAAAGDAGSWDDEIGPHISTILAAAGAGSLTAAELADALHTAPGPSPEPAPKAAWSWRWVGPGGILVALAIAAAVLALITQDNASNPFRLPVPQATTITSLASTTTTTLVAAPAITITEISIYDPLGDDAEFDQRLPSLTDGNTETAWRTERYFDPLSSVKAGVGIVVRLNAPPTTLSVLGSATTAIEVRWTPTAIAPDSPSDWETVASITLAAGETTLNIPERSDGLWLIWITDVAVQDDGEFHYSLIQEVRFGV